MRKVLQMLGLFMVAEGVSGTIDQIAVQPFFGVVLNAFNRFVVERLDVLEGYEIFTNLILAILGVVVVVAAVRIEST
ncbi:hypothetical protein [Nonomuraea sp. NPDC002799]